MTLRRQPTGWAGVITLFLIVSAYAGLWKHLPHELAYFLIVVAFIDLCFQTAKRRAARAARRRRP